MEKLESTSLPMDGRMSGEGRPLFLAHYMLSVGKPVEEGFASATDPIADLQIPLKIPEHLGEVANGLLFMSSITFRARSLLYLRRGVYPEHPRADDWCKANEWDEHARGPEVIAMVTFDNNQNLAIGCRSSSLWDYPTITRGETLLIIAPHVVVNIARAVRVIHERISQADLYPEENA